MFLSFFLESMAMAWFAYLGATGHLSSPASSWANGITKTQFVLWFNQSSLGSKCSWNSA